MATTIQSLERGLEILGILARSGQSLSLNEIAGHFTIDRSSVFRLITTLVKARYVRQDPVGKRYSLGYRVLVLAGSFSEQSHIESAVRPVMRRVLESTRQNTHLAVLDGGDVVFIAVEQPRAAITMNATIGGREPAPVTALGRAFMAFVSPAEQDAIIASSPLKKYTPATVKSSRELKKILADIRERRLAFDNEEYKQGVVCFAAPILDHRRQVIFSIGISGPRNLIEPHAEDYGSIVRNAGIEVSGMLGFPGDH
ncbi:MAG TPA: IclR family transcriptional regulator [Spirochaetes bacterium]|nr:IclR family transcriptional regulator [Spirochaetota bacterium]